MCARRATDAARPGGRKIKSVLSRKCARQGDKSKGQLCIGGGSACAGEGLVGVAARRHAPPYFFFGWLSFGHDVRATPRPDTTHPFTAPARA